MNNFKSRGLSIKGAILDKGRLCSYLEKLASEQITRAYSEKNTYPVPALKENFEMISKTYTLLNEHAKLKITIEPAGEWLLDNFYIIEEITKSILKEMNEKKYSRLIGLANGKHNGFARIYVLAAEIMAYTDGKIDEDSIKMFLESYQKQTTLTTQEIWNFPVFLQIVAIQNISEICEKIYNAQIQKYKVESIIERLVEQREKTTQNFNKQVKYVRNKTESTNYTFIEYLAYKLKSYGKKGIPYLQILEDQVNKIGTSIDEIINHVHFSLATNKVSIGNLIVSIKEISRIDFGEISNQIGGIEEILSHDPAKVYDKMDYNTKSEYQNKIQEISRRCNISEIYIAKILLKLAKEEAQKVVDNKDEESLKMHAKKSHIGYFLFEDVNSLYEKLEVTKKQIDKEKKSRIYMATNIILSMYLCFAIFTLFFYNSGKVFSSLFGAILLFLPITEIIMQTIVYVLGKIVKPKRIPKLDFSYGIPENAATFVVIPTILSNAKKVQELLEKLEIYYLANKSDNIYFAILGDVTSSSSKNEAFDQDVIDSGKFGIELLNKKYSKKDDFNKFHFLYRNRIWNPKEESFLGWERKRGILIQFNQFLLGLGINDFRYNSISEQINMLPKIKYIITLDSDTNLVLNSGLELIGAMEHILNMPIIENGRVISGHALIQPRVGVDLCSSSGSLFSKIFASAGGTDLYTNAISDVYQDNFDEGIFTGKGIYDLNAFSNIITNQIPENTVLSHDLLEGSYLRCGLASDVVLLDGFPSKYNSYMTRQKRWIRGDWQILNWVGSRIKVRNGSHAQNPLNPLSKFKILDNLRRSLVPVAIFLSIFVGMIFSKTPAIGLIILRNSCYNGSCDFGSY